jgi:hypothetical protein
MLRPSIALMLLTTPVYAASEHYCLAWARGAITMEVGHLNAEQRSKLTMPVMIDVLARFMLRCTNLEQDFDTPEITFLKDLYDQLKIGPVVNPPVVKPKPPEVVAEAADPPPAPPVKPSMPAKSPSKPVARTPAQICAGVHMRVVTAGKSWHCRK